jgi:hypothetical protein
MMQGVSERLEAASQEQAAQIEEASATINQWQEAYEQLNLQLKASQVINEFEHCRFSQHPLFFVQIMRWYYLAFFNKPP